MNINQKEDGQNKSEDPQIENSLPMRLKRVSKKIKHDVKN